MACVWERPSDRADLDEIVFEVYEVVVPQAGARNDDGGATNEHPAPPGEVEQRLGQRQGAGTWPNGERAVRLGNAEEILITLPTNPFGAMDVARHGDVFEQIVRGLRIDPATRRDREYEVSWDGALRAPVRWRPVSVRIYASPSLNVTVMTIIPVRARKISSRSFVRVGLRAAREVGRRIEIALDDAHLHRRDDPVG